MSVRRVKRMSVGCIWSGEATRPKNEHHWFLASCVHV